jgi:hypothetical protein
MIMSDLVRHTFRVSFDIELSLNAIDEQVIATVAEHMVGFTEADLHEFIRRDQALLQAVLAHPTTMRAYLLYRAAGATEFIHPDDQSLEALQTSFTESSLLAQIQDALPPDDYTYLKAVCEDDAFYDNTSFFEEALSVRQTNFTIEPLEASFKATPNG